jgi:hypothetical protein
VGRGGARGALGRGWEATEEAVDNKQERRQRSVGVLSGEETEEVKYDCKSGYK